MSINPNLISGGLVLGGVATFVVGNQIDKSEQAAWQNGTTQTSPHVGGLVGLAGAGLVGVGIGSFLGGVIGAAGAPGARSGGMVVGGVVGAIATIPALFMLGPFFGAGSTM